MNRSLCGAAHAPNSAMKTPPFTAESQDLSNDAMPNASSVPQLKLLALCGINTCFIYPEVDSRSCDFFSRAEGFTRCRPYSRPKLCFAVLDAELKYQRGRPRW